MLNRADRLRLFALLLWALPVAALLPLGVWWLWQNGAMAYWLGAMLAFSAAGFGLQAWLRRRDRRLLAGAQTAPDPHWPPKSKAAWDAIEAMAEGIRSGGLATRGRSPALHAWAAMPWSRWRGSTTRSG